MHPLVNGSDWDRLFMMGVMGGLLLFALALLHVWRRIWGKAVRKAVQQKYRGKPWQYRPWHPQQPAA